MTTILGNPPGTKIVSTCCGARLKWRKRRPGRSIVVENPFSVTGKSVVHIKGPRLRAYVCDECGKPDR